MASAMLIVFGVGCIIVGVVGRAEVAKQVRQENIQGSPDMNPEMAAAALREAGLDDVDVPRCSVAGQPVDDGASAKCFAEYMRLHALEATAGATYAELPRFATDDGEGTNDPEGAQQRPDGTPVDNPARNVWITATALSTALNMAYFAQQVAVFSVVTGVALLLTGVGFLVLTLGIPRPGEAV